MQHFRKNDRSPQMRRENKPMMPRSMHMQNSTRGPMMKNMPLEMKRRPPPPINPNKGMQPPKMRSIASTSYPPRQQHRISPNAMEREHMKRPDYKVRKMTPPHMQRSMSPPHHGRPSYPDERYMDEKQNRGRPQFSPPKKKPYRDERYERSRSPPPRRPEPSVRVETRPRPEQVNNPPAVIPSHVSRPGFTNQNNIRPGAPPQRPALLKTPQQPQQQQSFEPNYSTNTSNATPKKSPFALTLNERFSAVVESQRTEPRVKYTQQDLEKITIDIRRNIKPPSPTVRHIVNPENVKLVRRSNEGHRPMFDRDEIKQATRDMREEAYFEKKPASSAAEFSQRPPRGEFENYEVRPRQQQANAPKSLNDRWQNQNAPKGPPRDNRAYEDNRPYERVPVKKTFIPDSRPKPSDHDFKAQRYPAREPAYEQRSEYREPRPRSFSPRMSPRREMRRSSPRPRMRDGPPRPHMRSPTPEHRGHYPPQKQRYMEDRPPPPRGPKRYERHYSPEMEPPKKYRRSYSRSRSPPMYSHGPPEKYSKPWQERNNSPPRDPEYFHNPSYEPSNRGRGNPRMFRGSRGSIRSRGSRGASRGPYRGSAPRGGMRNNNFY